MPDTQGPVHKQIFVRDLRAQDVVRSTFLVKSKTLTTARNSKPYLALTLSDKSGDVDTRIWDDVDHLSKTFDSGDFVAVAGKAHQHQNRLQLTVSHLTPVPVAQVTLADYFPVSPDDREAQYAELIGRFQQAQNVWIGTLAVNLLSNPEIAEGYKLCPAAKTVHHAFIGGLLAHSLQLVRLMDVMAPFYPDLDRDLLAFGAAFHDFGKIYELSYRRNFGYTDEGQLVGHMAIAISLVDREIQKIEGFPPALEWHIKHLILSHHGRLEYGSPKRPATLEALMVSAMDDLDSKLQSVQALMATEVNASRWTSMHRAYEQVYYKPDKYVTASAEPV